ncbi:hypothetical protein DKG77_00705 [Flagellimonas aquimarina]|uniref:Doxx family protein n=2 Tax=Flagellimonas aquimarina TaxID=2201895 RepID=A0A316L0M6_9FLAO|nr:hypothetical protein DKG77_00705 [Allomuricauda koreensis]
MSAKKIVGSLKNVIESNLMAISIGVIYLWFGSLKFFPALSPAENLAKNTIHELTFGFISDSLSIILLAILEVGIGIFLLFNLWRRTIIIVALCHMTLTFTPLLLFPLESFQEPPLVPTLLGQYIGKNFVIVAALITMGKKAPLEKKRINKKS